MTDLLPPNAAPLERAIDAAHARLGELDVPLDRLWDPDRCPLDLLPWLAWALSVELWDPGWPEEARRRACREAIAAHREKGTPAAIGRAMRLIGAVHDYVERPKGAVKTALVRIYNSADILAENAGEISALTGRAKRLSVHVTVELHAGLSAEIPAAGGLGAVQLAHMEASY